MSEIIYTEEERDGFAISFAIWCLYNPYAQSLIAAKCTAYQLLEKYKDRPFIETDAQKQ